MKNYTEQEIKNALQVLDYCFGGDAKPSIEKSIEIVRHCIKMRNTPQWIDAQQSLPEQQGYGNLVKCNVIVRRQTNWEFIEPPEISKKEIVYGALFDVEQKIWHIQGEHLFLNALIDPDNLPVYCDYVSYWMYMPSIE